MNELLSGVAVDVDYVKKLAAINENGNVKESRTGIKTTSLFGMTARYDLRNGRVPFLLIKRIPVKTVIHETIWFLRGDTNIKYLKDNNVNIWDSWIDPTTAEYKTDENGVQKLVDGNLPEVYQAQWFKWEDTRVSKTPLVGYEDLGELVLDGTATGMHTYRRYINQFADAIEKLRTDPDCRRIRVTAWNVSKLSEMALPPCHHTFSFYSTTINDTDRLHIAVDDELWLAHPQLKYLTKDEMESLANDTPEKLAEVLEMLKVPTRTLSCHFAMRSSDFPLGYGFNIAEYGIITHIVAAMTNHYPIELIYTGDDVHVYEDQWEYTTDEGVEGGVGEIFNRWNLLVGDDDPLMVNGPKQDLYVAKTDGHEISLSSARIKLSDVFKEMKDVDFKEITIDDIEILNYTPMSTVPFPKAAV